jgi:hypothetical protein
MKQVTFKEFIFKKFQEWEYEQPNHRSSFTAFSKWLSDNSYQTIIKQQLVSDWIKGKYKPSEEKYLLVLEEKLGKEIYEILDISRPDDLYQYLIANWKNLSKEKREQINKIIEEEKISLPNETRTRSTTKL